MRNVISTVAHVDVSEEYGDRVRDLLDEAERSGNPVQVIRRTYQCDTAGQPEYQTRLVSYPAPGSGETVWAVEDTDPAVREVEETASGEEAQERYEEIVRQRAAHLRIYNDDTSELFDYSDVVGVPARNQS